MNIEAAGFGETNINDEKDNVIFFKRLITSAESESSFSGKMKLGIIRKCYMEEREKTERLSEIKDRISQSSSSYGPIVDTHELVNHYAIIVCDLNHENEYHPHYWNETKQKYVRCWTVATNLEEAVVTALCEKNGKGSIETHEVYTRLKK